MEREGHSPHRVRSLLDGGSVLEVRARAGLREISARAAPVRATRAGPRLPRMKNSLAALVIALGLTGSSCLGTDNLYHSIKNWNANLSEQHWISEIVYIGLWIVPVYPIALTGDVLIFNTISYWTGKDTIKDPGPFPGFSRKSGS
jgi:hypothetical protein